MSSAKKKRKKAAVPARVIKYVGELELALP